MRTHFRGQFFLGWTFPLDYWCFPFGPYSLRCSEDRFPYSRPPMVFAQFLGPVVVHHAPKWFIPLFFALPRYDQIPSRSLIKTPQPQPSSPLPFSKVIVFLPLDLIIPQYHFQPSVAPTVTWFGYCSPATYIAAIRRLMPPSFSLPVPNFVPWLSLAKPVPHRTTLHIYSPTPSFIFTLVVLCSPYKMVFPRPFFWKGPLGYRGAFSLWITWKAGQPPIFANSVSKNLSTALPLTRLLQWL